MTHGTPDNTGPAGDATTPGAGNNRDARGESPLGTPTAPARGTWEENAPEAAPPTGTPKRENAPATGSNLLPQDECDKLVSRMHHAVAGFVDGPRGAVEEADQVVEDIAARFTEAVTNRRRGLRASWQPDGTSSEPATAGDTEQLRLALRDYRELAERLLHV